MHILADSLNMYDLFKQERVTETRLRTSITSLNLLANRFLSHSYKLIMFLVPTCQFLHPYSYSWDSHGEIYDMQWTAYILYFLTLKKNYGWNECKLSNQLNVLDWVSTTRITKHTMVNPYKCVI